VRQEAEIDLKLSLNYSILFLQLFTFVLVDFIIFVVPDTQQLPSGCLL
jgi:hypothetical protein